MSDYMDCACEECLTKYLENRDEVLAYSYELATYLDRNTGQYEGWKPVLTKHKPCVPVGSIRNLIELVANI